MIDATLDGSRVAFKCGVNVLFLGGGAGASEVHPCSVTEALYRPYSP